MWQEIRYSPNLEVVNCTGLPDSGEECWLEKDKSKKQLSWQSLKCFRQPKTPAELLRDPVLLERGGSI